MSNDVSRFSIVHDVCSNGDATEQDRSRTVEAGWQNRINVVRGCRICIQLVNGRVCSRRDWLKIPIVCLLDAGLRRSRGKTTDGFEILGRAPDDDAISCLRGPGRTGVRVGELKTTVRHGNT